ncbi:response regulator [Rickettsiales bacterium]|nr:response regulator [Rickettsiales bacterium]
MSESETSVLIIEDNENFRSMALEVFEGCIKSSAPDAQTGLKKFKEICPDIVLLDIGLPDMSGLDLLPEIISYDPEAYVVMLTSSSISTDVEMAKKRGAIGYITKPFTRGKVIECISNYRHYKKMLASKTPEERIKEYNSKLKIDGNNKNVVFTANRKDSFQSILESWNVLFVDDNVNNREKAKKQLTKLGCKVDTAQTGEEVINKIKTNYYHIIFMDTKLSGMDGYEASSQIRSLNKRVPTPFYINMKLPIIIAMTESRNEVSSKLWQKSGMTNYMEKPARFSQLRKMIEKYAKEYFEEIS